MSTLFTDTTLILSVRQQKNLLKKVGHKSMGGDAGNEAQEMFRQGAQEGGEQEEEEEAEPAQDLFTMLENLRRDPALETHDFELQCSDGVTRTHYQLLLEQVARAALQKVPVDYKFAKSSKCKITHPGLMGTVEDYWKINEDVAFKRPAREERDMPLPPEIVMETKKRGQARINDNWLRMSTYLKGAGGPFNLLPPHEAEKRRSVHEHLAAKVKKARKWWKELNASLDEERSDTETREGEDEEKSDAHSPPRDAFVLDHPTGRVLPEGKRDADRVRMFKGLIEQHGSRGVKENLRAHPLAVIEIRRTYKADDRGNPHCDKKKYRGIGKRYRNRIAADDEQNLRYLTIDEVLACVEGHFGNRRGRQCIGCRKQRYREHHPTTTGKYFTHADVHDPAHYFLTCASKIPEDKIEEDSKRKDRGYFLCPDCRALCPNKNVMSLRALAKPLLDLAMRQCLATPTHCPPDSAWCAKFLEVLNCKRKAPNLARLLEMWELLLDRPGKEKEEIREALRKWCPTHAHLGKEDFDAHLKERLGHPRKTAASQSSTQTVTKDDVQESVIFSEHGTPSSLPNDLEYIISCTEETKESGGAKSWKRRATKRQQGGEAFRQNGKEDDDNGEDRQESRGAKQKKAKTMKKKGKACGDPFAADEDDSEKNDDANVDDAFGKYFQSRFGLTSNKYVLLHGWICEVGLKRVWKLLEDQRTKLMEDLVEEETNKMVEEMDVDETSIMDVEETANAVLCQGAMEPMLVRSEFRINASYAARAVTAYSFYRGYPCKVEHSALLKPDGGDKACLGCFAEVLSYAAAHGTQIDTALARHALEFLQECRYEACKNPSREAVQPRQARPSSVPALVAAIVKRNKAEFGKSTSATTPTNLSLSLGAADPPLCAADEAEIISLAVHARNKMSLQTGKLHIRSVMTKGMLALQVMLVDAFARFRDRGQLFTRIFRFEDRLSVATEAAVAARVAAGEASGESEGARAKRVAAAAVEEALLSYCLARSSARREEAAKNPDRAPPFWVRPPYRLGGYSRTKQRQFYNKLAAEHRAVRKNGAAALRAPTRSKPLSKKEVGGIAPFAMKPTRFSSSLISQQVKAAARRHGVSRLFAAGALNPSKASTDAGSNQGGGACFLSARGHQEDTDAVCAALCGQSGAAQRLRRNAMRPTQWRLVPEMVDHARCEIRQKVFGRIGLKHRTKFAHALLAADEPASAADREFASACWAAAQAPGWKLSVKVSGGMLLLGLGQPESPKKAARAPKLRKLAAKKPVSQKPAAKKPAAKQARF